MSKQCGLVLRCVPASASTHVPVVGIVGISVAPKQRGLPGDGEGLEHISSDKTVRNSHPATHYGIHEARQILQMLVLTRGGHPPFADACTYRFGSFGAHCGQKAHKMLSPTILGPSRLEGITQKVELFRVRLPRPVILFAVNHACLRCMKLETALPESTPDSFQYRLGLSSEGRSRGNLRAEHLDGWRHLPRMGTRFICRPKCNSPKQPAQRTPNKCRCNI
jgi:hypothetical protein